MNCKNCGAQLVGNEQVCPICGTPVVAVTGGMAPEMNQIPVVQPSPMPQMTVPGNNIEASPKKDGKVFAIVLAIIAVLAIGVGVVFALLSKPTEEKKPESEPEEQEEAKSFYTSYAGYMFEIPNDYTVESRASDGIVITGESVIYTIGIDYTTDYEEYKRLFMAANSFCPVEAIISETGKEYTIAHIKDKIMPNAKALEYMTINETNISATFVGLVIRSDYQDPSSEDLATLNTIIESAKKEIDIIPGEEADIGKDGIKNYISTFDSTSFQFPISENEQK